MLFFIICVLFAVFPQRVLSGAGEGTALCINAVIPSLLPFMLASACLIKSNFVRPLGCVIAKVLSPLTGLSQSGCVCFVIGLTGGYGAGAAAVRDCAKEGMITKKEAETLLAFCNNAGPLFVIGTVGGVFLGNIRLGVMLYAVNVLTALICAAVLGGGEKTYSAPLIEQWHSYKKSRPSAGRLISDCVASSAGAITSVCVFVISFSAVINLMQLQKVPMLASVIEVTCGVRNLAKRGSVALPAISSALSWGGISVQLQASTLCEGMLSMKKYYAGRIFSCVISYIITYFVYGDYYMMLLVINLVIAALFITSIIKAYRAQPRQRGFRQQRHS